MKHKKALLLLSFLFLAVILAFFGTAQEHPVAAIQYDGSAASIKAYHSPEEYLADMKVAAEDQKATLYYDKATANIALLNKEDNSLCFSAPYNIGSSDISPDQKELVSSPVIISYTDSKLKKYELNSFKDCAEYGQIKSESIPNGVRFTLTVGKLAQSEIVPDVMPESRLAFLKESLEISDYNYIIQSYRKITLNNNSDQNLLEDYPGLEKGAVYVLRSNLTSQVKKKLSEYFSKANYMREQLIKDEIAVYGAQKSEEEESANFTLTLEYTLENGDLVVNVPVEDITYDKTKYKLIDLTVLKYFDAADINENGFFLLPDGSGAISEFKANQKGTGEPFEVNLYGQDSAYQYDASLHSTQSARVPVFGEQKGGNGFIAIAEGGDAQMSVRSVIDESENALRYTHFVCHVRLSAEYTHSEYASYDSYFSATPTPYTGNYKVRYRFLSQASYSDMANAYREYLIKNGTLKQKNHNNSMSLTIDLLGAVQARYDGIFTDSKLYPLTTYSQSAEIAKELKESGFDNLNIKLLGWANGGMDYTVFNNVDLISCLGGKQGYTSLINAENKENIMLYPDVDISFARKNTLFDGFTLSGDAAHQLDNTYARVYPYNQGSNLGQYTRPYYEIKSQSMVKYAESLLKSYNYASPGLSLNSLGDVLNSDSSKKSGSRTDSMKDYIKIAELTSKKYSLMFTGGNAYTWKYAAGIENLPSTSSNYRNTSYSVPFLQMVLHGYISYSGASINLSSDPEMALLKAIENGEGLSFTLAKQNVMYLSLSSYQEYDSVEYDFWKDKIIADAEALDQVLKGTYDQEIIKHEYLTSEVIKVTYKNGISVIVNYSNKDFTHDGITVKAKSAMSTQS